MVERIVLKFEAQLDQDSRHVLSGNEAVEGNLTFSEDPAEQDPRRVYQMPFHKLLSEKLFF